MGKNYKLDEQILVNMLSLALVHVKLKKKRKKEKEKNYLA